MAPSGRSSIALALVLLASSCLSTSTGPPAAVSDFEGLWQYPGRGVWIHVWPDGFAFQCRIAPDGTVFASAGALAGSSVSWQQIWPVGSLALTEDGLLHLEDAWGVYLYQPGCPMSPPCTERLPRPVGEWKPRPPTVACVRGG